MYCSRRGHLVKYPIERSHPSFRGDTAEEIADKESRAGIAAQPVLAVGKKTQWAEDVNYGQGSDVVYQVPEGYPWKFREGVQPRIRETQGTTGAQRRKQRQPQILPANMWLRPVE